MNRLTPVFLVLLRLAIGWHFLFEGVEKLTTPGWSSAGYLRESSGPLADHFRSLAGDPVVEYFAVVKLPEGEDPTKVPQHTRMPPALNEEWDDYFARFVKVYRLDAPETPSGEEAPPANQKEMAQKKLEQRKDKMVSWLLGIDSAKPVTKSAFGVSAPVMMTPQQRYDEYLKKVKEVDDLEKVQLTTFGPNVGAKLTAAKGDMRRMRSDLLADIAAQRLEMKKALREVLTASQKKQFDPKEYTLDDESPEMARALREAPVVNHPTLKDFMEGPRKPAWNDWSWVTSWSKLTWADNAVRFGLLGIGACLILGLLTRTACIAGAVMLLSFYLAMPALPWLPENPKAEGHYLYINKNIIEMLALLALATTTSGRWVGLDGLIHYFKMRRRQPETPVPAPAPKPFDAGRDTPRPDLQPEHEPALTNGAGISETISIPRDSTNGH